MSKMINQCGERFQFDVVVVGSGIAALSYILELLNLKKTLTIALLTKGQLTDSNSFYAQGGIAAAQSSEDLTAHVVDTLKAGGGLCHESIVREILEKGPQSIEYLYSHDVKFDHDEKGVYLLGKEAGHSTRRIYHAGDLTGEAIMTTLLHAIQNKASVKIFEYHTAINLITQPQEQEKTEVVGVYALAERQGKIHTYLANSVVLATGGAGKVYRYTTNPSTATGDGVAMAYRAGARLANLEFYQFHPTLLYHPHENNFLISEALRGEGAYLRLPESHERFMFGYAEEGELATRDVVARAIFSEIEKSHFDFVYLDIRHQSKAFLLQRFPGIYQKLLSLGFDLNTDLIPVVPAAHYWNGGILTNVQGETDLPRLFAIGETACTGLHGANRLASNSLLEGVIMGREAAKASLRFIGEPLHLRQTIFDWDSHSVQDMRRASQINGHWRGLRGEMSSYAGIVRTEAGLADQLKLVLARRVMIEDYYWKYMITRDLIELRNIILVAELIVRAALQRKESRGGHYREDYIDLSAITAPSIFKLGESHAN